MSVAGATLPNEVERLESARPMVSVVLPIYNTEKYLRQCLDILKDHTPKEMKFIYVNDGSTDKSLEMSREYAAADSRFIITDKQNSGYWHAMKGDGSDLSLCK